MLNVNIIGLGRMDRLHMMNCLQVDGVKIIAAADPSKKAEICTGARAFLPEKYVTYRNIGFIENRVVLNGNHGG